MRWETVGDDLMLRALPAAAGAATVPARESAQEGGDDVHRHRRRGRASALAARRRARAPVLEVEARAVLEGHAVGDSICTAGVCLTVTPSGGDRFWADAMPETVRRTTLAGSAAGDRLNLERALTLPAASAGTWSPATSTASAGRRRSPEENALVLDVEAPAEVRGSASRRVRSPSTASASRSSAVAGDTLRVSLIPHTAAATTLARPARRDDGVNLEADLIGKYVARLPRARRAPREGLTWEKLAEAGFDAAARSTTPKARAAERRAAAVTFETRRRRGALRDIDEALDDMRMGKMVVVCDDEDRENEGDLTHGGAVRHARAHQLHGQHGRGLICLALTPERCAELDWSPWSSQNQAPLPDRLHGLDRGARGRHDRHLGRRPGAHHPGRRRPGPAARATSCSRATSSR